jgi:DNA-binding CsgD family transcriptional regulator
MLVHAKRKLELVQWLQQDLTEQAIAERMDCTVHYVKKLLAELHHDLDVRTTRRVAVLARDLLPG